MVVVGLITPLVVLPALALALVWWFEPDAPAAAGMLLVAACPIGGISNTCSYLARASTALSVTLAGLSGILAVAAIPLLTRLFGRVLHQPLRADAPAPGRAEEAPAEPHNTRLRLYVTGVEESRRFADEFLDARAKQWQAADVVREQDGTATVDYKIRLKKSVDLAAFVRELEHGDSHITRVELARIKSGQ